MQSDKKKILCFHGFGTNADVMSFQLKQFKKEFPEIEFIAPDGPIIVPKKVKKSFYKTQVINDKEIYSWIEIVKIKQNDYYNSFLPGIEKAINILQSQGPFYGVLGFSQGSSIVGKLCDLISRGQVKLEYRIKCFMYVSGMPFQNSSRDDYQLYKTPSLHFIGVNDFLSDQSMALSSQFLNPFIIYHNQGHKIPTMTYEQLKQIRQFFQSSQKDQEWAKFLNVPRL